jgi:hypothetical protein
MMSYQSLVRINERYQIAVLFVYLAMLLVAMAMMFVHPTITLLLFWIGLISLAAFALSEKFIGAVLRSSARHDLARFVCPRCGAAVHSDPQQARDWRCDRCDAAFECSGEERH